MLASLAGKLLEESESSSTSTYEGDSHDRLIPMIKQEYEDGFNKPCKSEFSARGNPASKSTTENTSVTRLQFSSLENDCTLEQKSVSECKSARCLKPLVRCENKKAGCDFLVDSGGSTEETGVVNVEAGFEQGEATGGLIADTFNLKDPRQLHVQSPESVHLDDDVKLPSCTDHVPNCSFEGYRNHSNLVCRDDDENYCKYYKFSDKYKSYRPPSRVGNKKIMKSAMTKYGRTASKLKSFEDTRTG